MKKQPTFSGYLLAFTTFLLMGLLLINTAPTGAAEVDNPMTQLDVGGHITGTVRDSAASPMPISWVTVTAYAWNSSYSYWQWVGYSNTDASGQYDLGGLAAGTYRVCFSSSNYIDECYNNAANVNSATDIAVTAGGTAAGIDAQLTVGGHITGTVRDNAATPMPISGVAVTAQTWNGNYWQPVNGASTNPNGLYDLGGLATGTYRVCFSSPNYINECYDNAANVDSATDIAVTAGTTAAGIDAQLAIGGHITGTVRDSAATPAPISGVNVTLWSRDGSVWRGVGSSTDASGRYDFGGLATGIYRVCFSSSNYIDECYNNASNMDSATDITVTAGATTAGIDAQLAVGGHITGTVRDSAATPMPISGISVNARTWNGSGWQVVKSGITNASGLYDLGSLATGTYRVCFSSSYYIDECYDNALNVDSATDIAVTAGATTTGIDAQLAIGGHITGTVRDSAATPMPIDGVSVIAYTWNHSGNNWHEFRSTWTNASGRFDIGGLATGTYRVCFFSSFLSSNYAYECYNNVSNVDSATDIAVTAGATNGGIDAQLAVAGHITGTVRDSAATPVPISGIFVTALAWSSSYMSWQVVGYTQTNASGRFDIGGLATGRYRVCFSSANYAYECYDNVQIVDSASDIAVTAGATTPGIDAQLAIGGHITGTVRDSAPNPMPINGVFVTAAAWNSNYGVWQWVSVSSTNASGQYDLGRLATGMYRVCFSSSFYAYECYNDAVNVDSATDILVTAGATTAGIDAQLTIGGHITGAVGDSTPSPMPISGVVACAYLWDGSQWQKVLSSPTNAIGRYAIGGLATGTYRVCFSSSNYANECYDNAAYFSNATNIAVTAGATTTGIDAQLVAAGHITGTVRDNAVTPVPISGVTVRSYSWNGSHWEALSGGITNSNGQYDIGGLATDTYRVCFSSPNYSYECYDNAANVDSAINIAVTASATVSGIDAQLQSPSNCQTGPLTIDGATFAAGTHTRASQTSIATQGNVTVQTGANVTLRAPLHRYGPGLRVAAGAVFRAQAGAVTCGAAAGTPTAATPSTAASDVGGTVSTAPAAAPRPFTGMDALPPWVQDRLAARGLDRQAMTQALLDPQGQWLLVETTQGLDPGDRNDTSDIYRLDLLAARLTLLSRTPAGTAGNGPSRYPAADALGDWVAFQSEADDLVTDDDNGVSDIFLYEVALGQTRRITATADQASAHPALDATGQDLLYDRQDGDGRRQVLADTLWGGTEATPVGTTQDGATLSLDRHHPAISADGRFVAYLAGATDATGSNACQVHLYDRDRGHSGDRPCPAALAAVSDTARPQFSADGSQLEWFLPGEGSPVRMDNPLMTVSAATVR